MSLPTNEAVIPESETSRPGFVRRVFSDLPYYALAQLTSTILNLTSIAVFTRLLSKTEYGVYALVLSAVTMVAELGFGWLQQALLRYWRTDEKDAVQRARFLSNLAVLFLGTTLICALLWPLLKPLLLPSLSWGVATAGFALLVGQTSLRLIQARARISRELRVYFLYSAIPPLIGLLLGLTLIQFGGLGGIALILALATGFGIVVSMELALRPNSFVPVRWSPDAASRAGILSFGWPIAVSAIGGVALDLSDRFLLAHEFGVAIAGEYAASYGIAIKVDAIAALMVSSAFPLLVRDYESKDRAVVAQDLSRLVTVFVALFLPAVVGMAVVARPLTAVLLGPEFQDAHRYIVPLMPGIFFMGLERYISKTFQLAGNNKPRVLIVMVAAIANVIANLVLLPVIGPVAAAWTTSAALMIMCVAEYVWSQRQMPYRLEWARLLRVGLACSGMAACVLFVMKTARTPALELVFGVIAGLFSYGIFAFALDAGGIRRIMRRSMS